jgi:hypothetical protein
MRENVYYIIFNNSALMQGEILSVIFLWHYTTVFFFPTYGSVLSLIMAVCSRNM